MGAAKWPPTILGRNAAVKLHRQRHEVGAGHRAFLPRFSLKDKQSGDRAERRGWERRRRRAKSLVQPNPTVPTIFSTRGNRNLQHHSGYLRHHWVRRCCGCGFLMVGEEKAYRQKSRRELGWGRRGTWGGGGRESMRRIVTGTPLELRCCRRRWR